MFLPIVSDNARGHHCARADAGVRLCPLSGGWHCDTFILGQFFTAPLYWKLDIGAEFTKCDTIALPSVAASSLDFFYSIVN